VKTAGPPRVIFSRHEAVLAAFSSPKLFGGLFFIVITLVLSILAPLFTPYTPEQIAGPKEAPPSAAHPFGTTLFGRDIFSQTLYGLGATFGVGFFGGLIATLLGAGLGFLAGYYGGTLIDELIMMAVNVFLVIPLIAVLIIISAYLEFRGFVLEAVIVGLFNWPWAARAVRSQTLSLKNNEYVNLSRISALPVRKLVWQDIAANMFAYLILVFILQFSGCVLAAATLDFIGLGPTRGLSLGMVLHEAVNWGAINLGLWWWAILPGAVLTALILSFFMVATGLDEALNPRLRRVRGVI